MQTVFLFLGVFVAWHADEIALLYLCVFVTSHAYEISLPRCVSYMACDAISLLRCVRDIACRRYAVPDKYSAKLQSCVNSM